MLLSKRRVLEEHDVPSPGREMPLLAIPRPRPGTVAMLLSKRQVSSGSVVSLLAIPPTPAGKPIAVLLSMRRVLEESGVPHPGREMPLLAIPRTRPGSQSLCC